MKINSNVDLINCIKTSLDNIETRNDNPNV